MIDNSRIIQAPQSQGQSRGTSEIERLKIVPGGYTPRNRSDSGLSGSGVMLGTLSPDGLVEIIRVTVLPLLLLKRKIIVYIRKSNPAAEANNANYLFFQQSLHEYLERAGVPHELIVVEDEDVGISGVYDSTYRPGLRRVEDMLLRGEVEAIVVVDIARIYRDPTNISPAILADRLKMHRVKIITLEETPPKVLDMTRDDDYDYFIEKCREAAKYRKRLRNLTTKAREQAVLRGEWSGSPVPIGWALVPQHKVRRNDRYETVAARLCVYPPHSERKLEIMRLGMHPKLDAWDRLWREILRQQLVISPFDNTIREYMMTRSCLKNCTKHGANGVRIPYNPDEAIVPTKNMLYNLLLDPLALGYILYGSGVRAGQKELKALDRKFVEKMGRTHDSQVRDYREFIGINEELAICRTPEDVAMFWALHEKFSDWEPETSRSSNFTSYVNNPKRTSPRAGRLKSENVANHWVGVLHCLHHGWEEDDATPILSHTMSYNAGVRKPKEPGAPKTYKPQWFCWRDMRQGLADRCVTIGSDCGQDKLTVVLDAFFLARIKDVLSRFSFTLKSAKGDEPSPEERKKSLQKEIATKDKIIKRKQATLESYTDIWAEDEEAQYTQEEIRKKQKEYHAEQITPVEGAKRKLEADLEKLESQSGNEADTAANIKIAEQVVDRVLQLGGWAQLSPNTRQRLISTFIDYVGVWIDRDTITDNVIILIQWKHGVRDILVTWRNPPLDDRPFTETEDAELRQWWASDCSVDHLRSLLQPGRRYNLVRRHAQQLGITDASRSRAWRTEYDLAGKSYAQLHPDAAYFWLADDGWAEVNRTGKEIKRGALPEGIIESVTGADCLMGRTVEEATSNRDTPPTRPR